MKPSAYIDEDGIEAPLMASGGQRLPMPQDASTGPEVGEAFPDLMLPSSTGGRLDLQTDRDGQKAAVVFHRSAVW